MAMPTIPYITVEDTLVDEGQLYVDFTLRLSAASVNTVTARYQTGDGTAMDGMGDPEKDYTATAGIVSFKPGEILKTVRVEVSKNADINAGFRESFRLVLDSPTNAGIARAIGVATIIDSLSEDKPVASAADMSVDEATGKAVFYVTLSKPASGALTIDYTTRDGSAKAGLDYTAAAGALSFSPGEMVKTVTVDLSTDGIDEDDESFDLILSSTGASIPDDSGTATVVGAGATAIAQPTIRVESAMASEETAGQVEFIVRLDAPGTQPVSVDYATQDGTAVAGTHGDYVAKSGTLVFATNETVKRVQVSLLNDNLVENPEGFRLLLSHPVNGIVASDSAVGMILDDESVLPVLSVSDPVVDEADAAAVFVLTLDRPWATSISLDYAAAGGTASLGSDYKATQGSLIFGAGETVKIVRVPVLNENTSENTETFELQLSNVAGALAPQPRGTATLVRNDASRVNGPTISVEDTSFGEAQGYGDFIVRLSGPSNNVVSVAYKLAGASAAVGNDYIDQSGTLSFAPGETAKPVRIIVVDDAGQTFHETFQLELSTPVNGVLGRSTAFATIVNDDGYDGLPFITVRDLVLDEKAQEAVFTLTLNWPSPGGVSLHFAIDGGTATAGQDYVAVQGTLAFAPGEVVRTIRVPLLTDLNAEPTESLRLVLSDIQGAAVPDAAGAGSSQTAVATLVADNRAAMVTPLLLVEDLLVGESEGYADFIVRLNAPGTQTVTVRYETLDGGAGSGSDFYRQTGTLSFAPGELVKTVRISLYGDGTSESAESFGLSLKEPVNAVLGRSVGIATLLDDDGGTVIPAVSVRDVVVDEMAGEAIFSVALDRPSAGIVTMAYGTEDDTATAGMDYVAQNGRLSFAPGEMVKTVRVALLDDGLREDNEAFKLVLSDLAGATVNRAAGIATLVADDGTASTQPNLLVDDTAANEGQGYVDFQVRLDRPGTQTVGVDYSLVAGTATAGSDFTDQVGRLSFAPGEVFKQVRVAVPDDAAAEGLETFKLLLANPSNALLSDAEGQVALVDNDGTIGTPVLSLTNVLVDEAAGEAQFTLQLDRASTDAVTLHYSTQDGAAKAADGDYTAVQGDLIFTPGQVLKTVRVPVLDDREADPGESFSLILSTLVGATAGAPTATATITDNDSGILTIGSVVVDEANGAAVLTVSLNKAATGPVSVDYVSVDGSATAGTDYTARQGTLSFSPGQTEQVLSIPLLRNAGDLPNETFDVVLSNPQSATLATSRSTVVIVDSPSGGGTAIPLLSIEDAMVGEGQGFAEFRVRLSTPSINRVSVSYGTLDHRAEAGSDYGGVTGSLDFLPGETEKTIKVALTDDSQAELTESFLAYLKHPLNAQIARGIAVGTLIDNDTLVSAPRVSVSRPVVDEAGREAVFTVVLDRASASAIGLDYATGASGDSAAAGSDYVNTAGHLDFLAGETVKTIRVPLLNDSLAESSEVFTLRLSNLTGGAILAQADGVAVIARSDSAATANPTISVEDTRIGEAQGWCDFVVRLSAPSDNIVSVGYRTSAASAFSPDDYADLPGVLNAADILPDVPLILSFAPGEVLKTIRVSIVDDSGPTFDETFQLALSSPVNAVLGRSVGFATLVNDDGFSGQTGQPTLKVADIVVDEASGEAVFTLSLSGPSVQAVDLDYSIAGGTASGTDDPATVADERDYTPVSGHLSFAPGEIVKTVRVPLIDDAIAEAAETFRLQITHLTGAAQPNPSGGAFPAATATVVASDRAVAATPLLHVEDLVVSENQGYADVVVRLDAPSAQIVSVNYGTQAGSASPLENENGDYYGQTGTLSFAPGEVVKTVRLSLVDDDPADSRYSGNPVEPTESFRLVLESPVNAGLGRSAGLVSLLDNDGAKVVPAVTVTDSVVDERTGEALFMVRLDRPSAGIVSLNYHTGGTADTATAHADYEAVTGSLSFAPGEMVKQVRVPLLTDALPETGENFSLVLTDITGSSLPAGTTVTGHAYLAGNGRAPVDTPLIVIEDTTVSEGQGYAEFQVRLNAPSAEIVGVNYALSGGTGANANVTAQSGSLNFAPGERVKSVRIALPDDDLADPVEALTVRLSDPTHALLGRPEAVAIILDEDGTRGTPIVTVDDVRVDSQTGEAVFAIRLDRPANGVVSLDYVTTNGSALAGTDFVQTQGHLDFVPGDMVRTVRVPLLDPGVAAGRDFRLQLSAVTGATASDPDARAYLEATGQPAEAGPRVGVDDALVGEGQGFIDFRVHLDAPGTQIVQVAYAIEAGGATPGKSADYLGQTGTLAFAPGETQKLVRIALVDDGTAERVESMQFRLSSPANAELGRAVAVGTILDNDRSSGQAIQPATPFIAVTDTVVDETAGSAQFTVKLDRPASGVVTVDYATQAGSAAAGSDFDSVTGRLSFAPGEMAKTVLVAIRNDADSEASETFSLVLSHAHGATLAKAQGAGMIAGNDGLTASLPLVSVEDVRVSEGQGYADVLVRLSAPSGQTVGVDFALGAGNATLGSDFIGQSGHLSFAPGEVAKTVRIALLDDAAEEFTETFNLTLSAPTHAVLGKASGLVVVTDNDGVSGVPVLSIADVHVDEAAGEAVFSLVLDRPSSGLVSLTYSLGSPADTAAAGADYTAGSGSLAFLPGETVQQVRVPVLNDRGSEVDERFTLVITHLAGADPASDLTATATLADNDATPEATPALSVGDIILGESQGYAEFAVRLSAPGTRTVTVQYTTQADSATTPADYVQTSGTLAFAPGEILKLIRVPVVADAIVESPESFTLKLSQPINATLAEATGRATLIDDGSPVPPVITIADLTVDETVGTASLIVSLDKPTLAEVQLDWVTLDGSALAGADYAAAGGTVVFAPGQTSRSIQVPILNDTARESAETFEVRLAAPVAATLADDRATVTIAASDATPPVAVNDTATVSEDSSVLIAVLANDSDPDGGPLSVQAVTSAPRHGTTVIEGNQVRYTPAADYFGSDAFVYRVTDANGDTAMATVSLVTQAVNDAPVLAVPAPDQLANAHVYFQYRLPTGQFQDPDTGDGDVLHYSARRTDGSALPSWLVFDPASRTFAGTPGQGDAGVLSIWVLATDLGFLRTEDVFTLTVVTPKVSTMTTTPISQAPATADQSFTVTTDTPFTLRSTEFPFSDANGDGMEGLRLVSLPQEGSLLLGGQAVGAGQTISRADLDGGLLTWQASAHMRSWTDTFRLQVWDGSDYSVGSATFSMKLTPPAGARIGTDGADTLRGTGKADLMIGHGGDDALNGQRGRDRLYGEAGNDVLRGGEGQDALYGGQGQDRLLGHSGSDTLHGGAGNDYLDGGGGRDTYLYGLEDLVAGDKDTLVATRGDGVQFDQELLSRLTRDGVSLSGLAGQGLAQSIDSDTSIAWVNRSIQIDLNQDGVFQAGQDFQIEIIGSATHVVVDATGTQLFLLN